MLKFALLLALSVISTISLARAQQPTSPISQDSVVVLRVIAGDIIEVRDKQKRVQVRLLGITAPRISATRTPESCYGVQARDMLRKIIGRQKVVLSTDPASRDGNPPIARYAHLPNGKMLNVLLLENGAARLSSEAEALASAKELRDAERVAREQKVGLWTACQSNQAPPGTDKPKICIDIAMDWPPHNTASIYSQLINTEAEKKLAALLSTPTDSCVVLTWPGGAAKGTWKTAGSQVDLKSSFIAVWQDGRVTVRLNQGRWIVGTTTIKFGGGELPEADDRELELMRGDTDTRMLLLPLSRSQILIDEGGSKYRALVGVLVLDADAAVPPLKDLLWQERK